MSATKNQITAAKAVLIFLNDRRRYIDLENVARDCDMRTMELYDLMTHAPATEHIQGIEYALGQLNQTQVGGLLMIGRKFGLYDNIAELEVLTARASCEIDVEHYNSQPFVTQMYQRSLVEALGRELAMQGRITFEIVGKGKDARLEVLLRYLPAAQ